MRARTAALYARVSSQQQEERGTIASQVAALRQYAAEHDYLVPEEWIFQDEGYSGALLVRPGLERLRDLAAQGELDVVLAYSPDRLARKYAYQVLLVEEFARSGVEVVFLKSPRGDSAEDELLLQFQGMIAEYERAQIAERTRRGKLHRARAGDVSVLGGAPYGYRYVRESDTIAAHYEVIESEAHVVQEVFRLYTKDDYSIGALARHLSDQDIPTRTRKRRWDRSVIWAMLRNPAYVGQAAFGKTRVADRPKKLTRPMRQQGGVPARQPAVENRPPEEWIEIPVPAIVDETTFALAAEQLKKNKQFARRNTREPTLLQGLLACRQCGYAYYRCSTTTSKRRIYYYRCLGSDDYRWEGGRVCSNRPVRQDYVDEVVWNAVVELLAHPAVVRQELDRRLEERRQSSTTQKQKDRLLREVARHQNAVKRLIEAYQEELISIEELRARIPELRTRENAASAQLVALEAQLIDQQVYLKLAENLESFLTRLEERAQTLSVEERQRVLRLVVKEVQVDRDRIVIKHCISPTDGDSGSGYRLRGGSQRPALRSPLVSLDHHAVLHDPRLKHPADDPQHALVGDPSGQASHQYVVVDPVKELLQIHIHHDRPALGHVLRRFA
ncbi:MAG: recombinase family protein [Candidatus Eisenbacteria bacterium]|nr:recombinase family protein [Candidatus Eisenbacteria bacterium]